MELQLEYQPFKLPVYPKWYHAYVSVHFHPGKGWKWVHVLGPTRSLKDAEVVTGFVEGSKLTAELVAFEDLMQKVYRMDIPAVRVYGSMYLSRHFVEPGRTPRRADYVPRSMQDEKLSYPDELSTRIEKMLSRHCSHEVRFSVASDSFVGKRFADELARN